MYVSHRDPAPHRTAPTPSDRRHPLQRGVAGELGRLRRLEAHGERRDAAGLRDRADRVLERVKRLG